MSERGSRPDLKRGAFFYVGGVVLVAVPVGGLWVPRVRVLKVKFLKKTRGCVGFTPPQPPKGSFVSCVVC